MVGSVRDDRSWQVVITYGGTAYICDRDEVRHRTPPKLREYPLGVELGDPRLKEDRDLESQRNRKLIDEHSELIFIRFESFAHGNDYVGSKASQDDKWVKRLHKGLSEAWPTTEHDPGYIDYF
jgi:hypothetical protein